MNYYSKFVLIFLLFVCFSCSDKQQTEEIRFAEAEAQITYVDDIFTWCPAHITYTTDNYLLSINACKDTVLQVVNLAARTEEWIATKGDGPNEIGQLRPFAAGGEVSLNVGVRYWDPNKQAVFKAQLKDGQLTFEQEYSLRANLVNWAQMAKTDKGFITNSIRGSHNFQKIDFDENIEAFSDFYPPLNAPQQGAALTMLYYKNIDFQPSRNIVVSALTNLPYVILYDQNLNQINQLKTKDIEVSHENHDPRTSMILDQTVAQHYLQVIAGSDYIYAVNTNGSYEDFPKRIFKPIIEIYDYDLNHVGNLKLDQSIRNMTIDFGNKVLYFEPWSNQAPEDHSIGKVVIPKSLHHLF